MTRADDMTSAALTHEGYTDSHCHLYDTRKETLDQVLAAARDAGVTTMITVGCDEATTRAAIEIAAAHEGVYATAGLHPHHATDGVASIASFFDARDGGSSRVIAVGECGLDYHYDHSPRDIQRGAFAEQIRLAHDLDLPLIIHTREAWDDTLAILDTEGVPPQTIFHCFTGGPDEASACLERGAFISFSGIVTFPSAADVQAAAQLCPIDRILAETDSPYLAPVPYRGKTNQPAFVTNVVAQLAALRNQPVEELRDATVTNARTAFPALGG